MTNVEKALILPPNKQLEAKFEFSKTPVLYDELLFLDFNKNGNCFLGSSNVTGTFWEGTLLYFTNAQDLENFKYSEYYIYMTASDGKFVNQNTIALAEDTGVLNILCVDEDHSIQPMNYFRHIKCIPQIAVWDKSSKVLSCSGRSLNIWDINSIDRKPCYVSDNVHLEDINSVDNFKNDTNILLSAASDRRACLWDVRNDEAPIVLYMNEFCSLSRIAVDQQNTNNIIIGTEAGDVYLIDHRRPNDFISVFNCFESPVNCIVFNESHQFAVCGNTEDVLICSSDKNIEEMYRFSDHTGPVKDLKWQGDVLYSCGFGKKLIKHVLKEG